MPEPPGGFPFQQLGRSNRQSSPHTNVCGQFGSIVLPGDATACVAAQTRVRDEFHRLNQDWVIKPRLTSVITADSPFPYELRTPVEKFKALAGGNLGIGTLATVQWVMLTSDGREPEYSKPVVLVLGPLIAPTHSAG